MLIVPVHQRCPHDLLPLQTIVQMSARLGHKISENQKLMQKLVDDTSKVETKHAALLALVDELKVRAFLNLWPPSPEERPTWHQYEEILSEDSASGKKLGVIPAALSTSTYL